jgi:predicted nucleic acid-binding protein
MIFVGYTLDTGVLIALERRNFKVRELISSALGASVRITVPAVVLTEWWRKGASQANVLLGLAIEQTPERVYRSAGEALGKVTGATPIDAIVMASAAQRGDSVYTSDFEDLDRLHTYFRSVHRVVRV